MWSVMSSVKIDGDREDGFAQKSKRKTCKCLNKASETTSTSRSNKFDVSELAECDLEVEEVNEVDVV